MRRIERSLATVLSCVAVIGGAEAQSHIPGIASFVESGIHPNSGRETEFLAPVAQNERRGGFAGRAQRVGTRSGFRSELGESTTPASACAVRDRKALAALFRTMDGENWRRAGNWLSDEPLVNWYGVTVDARGCVTRLELSRNGLQGEIPADLGALSALKVLDLSENNQITGMIPPELGDLHNLEHLDLTDQSGQADRSHALRGSIPRELGKLAKLRVLGLGWHLLGGEIPVELGGLAKLEVLYLAGNRNLGGEIPSELGNLSRLRSLRLNHNDLHGSIPGELAQLSSLKALYVSFNPFTGCVPDGFRSLRSLVRTDIDRLDLPFCETASAGAGVPSDVPIECRPCRLVVTVPEFHHNCTDHFSRADLSLRITRSDPPVEAQIKELEEEALAITGTFKSMRLAERRAEELRRRAHVSSRNPLSDVEKQALDRLRKIDSGLTRKEQAELATLRSRRPLSSDELAKLKGLNELIPRYRQLEQERDRLRRGKSDVERDRYDAVRDEMREIRRAVFRDFGEVTATSSADRTLEELERRARKQLGPLPEWEEQRYQRLNELSRKLSRDEKKRMRELAARVPLTSAESSILSRMDELLPQHRTLVREVSWTSRSNYNLHVYENDSLRIVLLDRDVFSHDICGRATVVLDRDVLGKRRVTVRQSGSTLATLSFVPVK